MNEKVNNEYKIRYSSKEVIEMSGISLRTFRYRINEIKKDVGENSNQLYKKNGKWVIHQKLLNKFLSKTGKNNPERIYDIKWKSFVTWIPEDNYPMEYHSVIIKEVIDVLPNALFLPVIETSTKGINHVHMVADVDVDKMKKGVRKILRKYWTFWECRLEVEPIRDKVLAVDYILKDQLKLNSDNHKQLIKKILKQFKDEKFY